MKQFNSSFNNDFFLTQPVCNAIENVKNSISFYLKFYNEAFAESYILKKGINVIGRDGKCDICISDPSLSKRHAMIEVTLEGSVFIQDLGSLNKTYRNRCELRKKVMYELTEGNDLVFGLIPAKFLTSSGSPNFDDNCNDYNDVFRNINNDISTELFGNDTDKSFNSFHKKTETSNHKSRNNSFERNLLLVSKKIVNKSKSPYGYKNFSERMISSYEQSFENFNKGVELKKYGKLLKKENTPCSTSTPFRNVSKRFLNNTFRSKNYKTERLNTNLNESSFDLDIDMEEKISDFNKSVINKSNVHISACNFDDTEIIDESHTDDKSIKNNSAQKNKQQSPLKKNSDSIKSEDENYFEPNKIYHGFSNLTDEEDEETSEKKLHEEFINKKSAHCFKKNEDNKLTTNILNICDDSVGEIDDEFDVISETDLEDNGNIYTKKEANEHIIEGLFDVRKNRRTEESTSLHSLEHIIKKSTVQKVDDNSYEDLIKDIFSEDDNQILSPEIGMDIDRIEVVKKISDSIKSEDENCFEPNKMCHRFSNLTDEEDEETSEKKLHEEFINKKSADFFKKNEDDKLGTNIDEDDNYKEEVNSASNSIMGCHISNYSELKVIVNKINVSSTQGVSNVDIDSKENFSQIDNSNQTEFNNEISELILKDNLSFVKKKSKNTEDKNFKSIINESDMLQNQLDKSLVNKNISVIDFKVDAEEQLKSENTNECIISEVFDAVPNLSTNNENSNNSVQISAVSLDSLPNNVTSPTCEENNLSVKLDKKKRRRKKSSFTKKKKSSKEKKSIDNIDLPNKNQLESELKIFLNNVDEKDVENKFDKDLNSSFENFTQIISDSSPLIENQVRQSIFPDLFYEQPTQKIDCDDDEVILSTQVICETEPVSSSNNNNYYSQAGFSQIATQVLPEIGTNTVKTDESLFRKPLSAKVKERSNFRTTCNSIDHNEKRIVDKKSMEKSQSLVGGNKIDENKENLDVKIELSEELKVSKTTLLKAVPKNVVKDIYSFDSDGDDFLEERIGIKVFKKQIKPSKIQINKKSLQGPSKDQICLFKSETREHSYENHNSSNNHLVAAVDIDEISPNGKEKRKDFSVNNHESLIRENNSINDLDSTNKTVRKSKKSEITTKINCTGLLKGKEVIPVKSMKNEKSVNSLETVNVINKVETKRQRGRPKKSVESQPEKEKSDKKSNSVRVKENKSTKSEDIESGPSKKENISREKRKFKSEDKEYISSVSKKTKYQRQQINGNNSSNAGSASVMSKSSRESIEYNEPEVTLIMFTGIGDVNFQKIILDLGGEIVDDSNLASHLVTDQVRRTLKFLCCLARGIPIVTPEWLNASKKCNNFVGTRSYIVKKNANTFNVNLLKSIALAQNYQKSAGGIMAHYRCIVFVTDNTKPEPYQLEKIIVSAGGKMLLVKDVSFYEYLNDIDSKHICIADIQDVNRQSLDLSARFRAMKEKNIEILTVEFLLQMIMEQKWPQMEQYRINI